MKPLETNGDALKLAELGSKYRAIDVYVKHEDIDGNEQANEAVQSPLDEPVLSPLDESIDSLLDSPIDELVDDETGKGNGAGISAMSAGVNDARKNVKNCAGSFGVAPASGHKNGNSTGEVHGDSDKLVSLASLNEDRDTLIVLTYNSVDDQLELYVGMKFSSQAVFREYLVDYALKGG
ncbi:hypothetical protein FEM48_Zijuj03G0106400 [Ziziphus jujuba var. spinosa]|uniref:Uncharacterized protein n=1 Tax=Ziziphus jujuba var. spinosa TaxID=714518 RepID=A0A978VPT9_ZIZJJ|nr:hypothetical protein FEM48_Zijuj03G0106400 [Ziziphus jujuba var. spinosa]